MAPLFTSRTIKIFFLIISTRIPFVHFVKQFCPHYFEKHSPVLQIIDVSLVPWKCVSLRALVRFLLLLLFNYELLRSGRAPWRRKWQPTTALLHGKSYAQRSLVGYSPRGHQRVGHDLVTKQQQQRNKQHLLTYLLSLLKRLLFAGLFKNMYFFGWSQTSVNK